MSNTDGLEFRFDSEGADSVSPESEERPSLQLPQVVGEVTSRRRSPDLTSMEQSFVVNMDNALPEQAPSSQTSAATLASRQRAFASLVAQILPTLSVSSSGSGGNSGAVASEVMSRALNNLAQANQANASEPRGESTQGRSSHRRSRGPLQLRSLWRDWRSSNSDISSDSDSEDRLGGNRRHRSGRRHDARTPLMAHSHSESATSSDARHSAGERNVSIDLEGLTSIENIINAGAGTNPLNNNASSSETADIPTSSNSAGNAENRPEDSTGNENAGLGSTRTLLRTLSTLLDKGFAFILLILVKFFWDHSLGILVMLGLSGTFWHANKMLKNQVSLKERRSLAVLMWIMIFLSSTVYLIFLVFQSQELGNALLLQNTHYDEVTTSFGLWHLFWVIGISDHVIRFGAIGIKALVVALPRKMLPYKFRGKYYLLVETLSHFYRHLTPIRPWLRYLWGDEDDNKILGGILVALYSVFKLHAIRLALIDFKNSMKRVKSDTSYGTMPSKKSLQQACAEAGGDEAGANQCPICQEEFKEPIELSCKHIFCEECVSMWFDRERTCPLCRATIADDPKWRDGSTSMALQFY